jgi:hypothetical protein
MVPFSAPYSQEGLSRMFQWNSIFIAFAMAGSEIPELVL